MENLSNIENFNFLPIVDNNYLDNIEYLPSSLQDFFNKNLSQKILQCSPYELNNRLDLISTGFLGELSSDEMEKHFKGSLYPDLVDEGFDLNSYSSELGFNFVNNINSNKDIKTINTGWTGIWKDVYSSENIRNIYKILEDIGNNGINSYNELINSSKKLSEKEKLFLLSAMGFSLGYNAYDISSEGKDLVSKEEFFEIFQRISNGGKGSLGVCRQIHSSLERLATNLGLDAAAVGGFASDEGNPIGHIYAIVKSKEGIAILNYGNVFLTDTNNVEKVLELYQEKLGTLVFNHEFFNNDTFRYNLITKSGKKFLNFIDYKITSKDLEDSLLQGQKDKDFSLFLDIKDSFISSKIEFADFFLNITNFSNNNPSVQFGYDNVMSFKEFQIGVSGNVYGISFEGAGKSIKKGFSGDLRFNTINPEGFNIAFQSSAALCLNNNFALFEDLQFPFGISYTGYKNNLSIEPYLIFQPTLKKIDLSKKDYSIFLNEIKAGFNFENDNFSFNPYIIRRIWGTGGGINLEVSSNLVKLNTGIEAIQSNYKFCPDKLKVSAGLSIPFGIFNADFGYENEIVDYDGEISQEPSLNIGGRFSFE